MNMFKNNMFVFIILLTILSTTVGLLTIIVCGIDKIEVNQYKTAQKINKIREQKTNILRCIKII